MLRCDIRYLRRRNPNGKGKPAPECQTGVVPIDHNSGEASERPLQPCFFTEDTLMLGGTRIGCSPAETIPDFLGRSWPDDAQDWIYPLARDEEEGPEADEEDEDEDEDE